MSTAALAEREGERLHARVQKLDRECMVVHPAALTYQLIKALIGDRTAAVGYYVRAMVLTGRRTIDAYAKPYGFAIFVRTQHQMQIPRMEAIPDAARPLPEGGVFLIDFPGAGQAPLIECRRGRR
jgi:hypothetical protein